jgi:hypothetical protein
MSTELRELREPVRDSFSRIAYEHVESGTEQILRIIRNHGETRSCSIRSSCTRGETAAGRHVVAAMQDVTQRLCAEAALCRLSDRDHLTGLGNRRAFDLRAKRQLVLAWKSGGPFGPPPVRK